MAGTIIKELYMVLEKIADKYQIESDQLADFALSFGFRTNNFFVWRYYELSGLFLKAENRVKPLPDLRDTFVGDIEKFESDVNKLVDGLKRLKQTDEEFKQYLKDFAEPVEDNYLRIDLQKYSEAVNV